MSTPVGAPRRPTRRAAWWGEAVGAYDDLGLSDVAALLRRLDPQQPDFDLADALYGEYDDLTAAGAWHGDDAIRTALRSRVERTPEEYGVRDVPPPPPSPYGELLPTGADVFLRRLGELSGD